MSLIQFSGRQRRAVWAGCILIGMGSMSLAWALEGEGAGKGPKEADPAGRGEESRSVSSQTKTAGKKGRRPRVETEAEGTEAPNRFEADPVIKSRYQLNGEPLEVDPD